MFLKFRLCCVDSIFKAFFLSYIDNLKIPTHCLAEDQYYNTASFKTADICEKYPALLTTRELRILAPSFGIYGRCRAFSGPVVTAKVIDDNVLVREILATKGEGRVLLIDAGGDSSRCAIIGGKLTVQAKELGWAGIVVNGCIRDVDDINDTDFGVRALASNPVKPGKKRVGQSHVALNISGMVVLEGEWLYADSDGILISKYELSV
ncbi:Regulator of ribonuclease activity A [Parasponia andersonii]|uniref:4-hydroxy-4-methyl-2-oxoglutarate aldolase n=1 Tax=Parasponia andersonii TaxID=3476 RepID=A0A2P5CDY0_PARAD|nr:Regulator of ribonuclease activity A [Parasponia andersonii]